MVTKAEYEKAKAAVEKAYTADSIKSYSDAYKSAKASWSSTNDAYKSASGLLVKNSGWTSSGGTSSWWASGNATSWWDIYGDKSKNATTNSPMDFSSYSGWNVSAENRVFGENAKKREQETAWFLTNRNNGLAYEIYNNRKNKTGIQDVNQFLSQYDDFNSASQEDRDNTIRAITTRLSEIENGNWDTITDTTKIKDSNGDWTKITDKLKDYNGDGTQDREWYYFENGEYYRAYWYDSWSKELQDEFDRLPDAKKKEVSNMWADALQNYLKLWTDYKRTTEYLDKKHDIDTDLYNNSKRQAEIQMGQTLRHAEEWFNNLKQNWQYLGNMWMPWVSATKMEAIWDAIQEAKTTLAEIEELEDLKMDAMVNQWKEQELAYAKQIDDLTYNLTWQTSQEFVDALSKFTAAELEGNLDTIDGITAFRRELLDNMDKNLSWITSASLDQMKYITQQYQDVADKMYEYAQNANKVNTDMSTALWYYVDMNGNPIFNAKGETITVPKDAPLNPIYDKDSWNLIVFWYDESWNIVANVQQIVNKGTYGSSSRNNLISWTWAGTMRTERNNNPTAMTTDVAKSLWMVEWVDYEKGDPFTTWDWKTLYTAKLIGDPIEATVKAFDNAASKGIWIFYTQWGKQRWTHTAMTNEQWMALSPEEKKNVVLWMLQKEWGDINKMAYYNQWGNTQYPAALVRLFNKDKLTDSDYKWLEDEGISRWDFEEMRNDYLKQQWWDVAYWKWMGSSILDKVVVSEDNKASQNEDYGFASRAWRADEAIKELEKEFSWTWNWDTPEWMKTDKHKLFDSYKEAFINAWLRKESWANITDAEFIKAEKFFPKVWDSQTVIAEKQKLREGIIEWLFQSSWKANDGTDLVEIYRNNKDKKIIGEDATTDNSREWILDKLIETNVNGEGGSTTFDESWVR